MDFARELDAALSWTRDAGKLALGAFTTDVPFQTKADGTPVTEADRGIESMIRKHIAEEFDGDAVLGEEEGLIGEGPRRWIVDPIDGTQNFRRGIPIFATLIALEDDDGLAVGVASAPALGATWWATRGGGAFRDGTRINVSSVATLEDAHIASGGLDTIRKQGLMDGFTRLCEKAARHRSFGDFWGHVLVAQGSVDAMIDPVVSVWDLAAVRLIVEEAGGRFTPVTTDVPGHESGSGVSSNGRIHAAVLNAING